MNFSVPQKPHEIFAILVIGRRGARLKNSGRTSYNFNGASVASQQSALKEADNWSTVFFVEFPNTVVAGLTVVWMQFAILFVMNASWVVVGIDLEWHQAEGIKFLWARVVGAPDGTARGCVLADHMGLGKTLQLIGALRAWFGRGSRKKTALVIAPAFVPVRRGK